MTEEDKSVEVKTQSTSEDTKTDKTDKSGSGRSRLSRLGGRAGSSTPAGRKRSMYLALAAIATGLAVFVGLFGVLIYKYKSDSPMVYAVSKVVPYPVMRVNNAYVSYREYLFEVASVKHYYENQPGQDGKTVVDFKTTEGKAKLVEVKNKVIEQLKNDSVARQLITKNKIAVSKKEIDDQIAQITQSAGGTDKVKDVLAKYYGWTLADLRTKVEFQLAQQKLQESIGKDETLNAQYKSKAQDVLSKVKAGGDFAELAKQFSEDSSAARRRSRLPTEGSDRSRVRNGYVRSTTRAGVRSGENQIRLPYNKGDREEG